MISISVAESPRALPDGTECLHGPDALRDAYAAMARAANPYGDGRAAGRICTRLVREMAA